jgi:hypothetical protein
MAEIQGSDGLVGKRKIAILNIDSIFNNIFLSAYYNKFKMGLYVYIFVPFMVCAFLIRSEWHNNP